MSDFESMRKKHRKDSMISLSFAVLFILLFLSHDYFSKVICEIYRNPEQIVSVIEQSWTKIIGIILFPVLTYLLGIFTIAKRDFYYGIDNKFFKKRIKVGQYICSELLIFKMELSQEGKNKVESFKKHVEEHGYSRSLMDLFYRYIENTKVVNPALKSFAFEYWGDYFSSITFIFFSIIALMTAIVIIVIDGSFSIFRLVITLIVMLVVFLNYRSINFGKVGEKIFEIPKTQIKEIHNNAEKEFLADLMKEDVI